MGRRTQTVAYFHTGVLLHPPNLRGMRHFAISDPRRLIEITRKRFGRPRAEIEQRIPSFLAA